MYKFVGKLFCILFLTAVINSDINVVEENDDEKLMQNCVISILEKNFVPEDLVLAVNIKYPLNHPVVRLQLNQTVKFKKFVRINFYVLNMTVESFSNTIHYIRSFQNFNPRAKFLVIVDKVSEDIFKLLARVYVTKVVVVETTQNLFTYSPYSSRNISQPDTSFYSLGHCSTDHGNPEMFRYKLPKTWENSTLRVSYKTIIPYSINPHGRIRGIEIFMLEMMKLYLKYKTKYTLFNGTYYNVKIPKSYYEAFGNVMRHEADVALGAFYLKFEEHKDFDVSFAYLQDGVYWVVPKAKVMMQWKRIIRAFQTDTWITLLMSLLLFGLIYSFYFCFSNVNYDPEILMDIYGILIEYTTVISKRNTTRILLILWIYYCLIISTAFKSQMMNILSGAIYEHQINSLQEIVESDLIISMHEDYASLYNSEGLPLEEYVYKNNIHCEDFSICVLRTALKGDMASTAIGRHIQHIMPEFIGEDGVTMIHVLKEKVYPMSIHMIFSKGYPMFEQIDRMFLLLETNGVVDRAYSFMKRLSKLDYFKKMNTIETSDVNDLAQMGLCFFLLYFGEALSLIVFILEIILHKFGSIRIEGWSRRQIKS